MSTDPHYLEQFLRAVHRRFVLARVVESAGAGALAGCAAAGLVLPLLLWRGEPAVLPAAGSIALGAVAGFWWGVARRPTPLAAAMEADRQLDCRDLLSTAAGVRAAGARDPWSQTVLALADARCRRHAPSQVVLRRYGSRAWGGIALAAAGVLTLAALLGDAGTAPAAASRRAVAVTGGAERRGPGVAADPAAAAARRGTPRGAGASSPESPSVESPADEGTSRRERDGRGSDEVTSASARPSGADGGDGQGGGAGTPGERRTLLPAAPVLSSPRRAAPPPDKRAGGTPAGGGAEASGATSGTGADIHAGPATPVTNGSSDRAAPWESSTWPADASAAGEAVEAGRVPDAYRDLVREYFNR
jgi:hypothetical protein